MTEQSTPATSFDALMSQPLIGIPLWENGREIVRYFVDVDAADEALAKRRGRPDVRRLAGVWKDLDWDEAADALDRIRHESTPTPPIDLDI